eukprot:CAMPEP_0117587870 /NCGR_PEP_ID=MMETSP0784-20121206/69539_1 /TAXON_ID=39447 /ORGANISM="" /LENGTH=106 /DNA_ID=CAMNT_0005389173 /DNA_START=132 /DNA_END=452 /DNA_ORIENTATION=+
MNELCLSASSPSARVLGLRLNPQRRLDGNVRPLDERQNLPHDRGRDHQAARAGPPAIEEAPWALQQHLLVEGAVVLASRAQHFQGVGEEGAQHATNCAGREVAARL